MVLSLGKRRHFGNHLNAEVGAELSVVSAVDAREHELVKEYNVPENHESVEYRLFVNGNDAPLTPGEEDSLVVLYWLRNRLDSVD